MKWVSAFSYLPINYGIVLARVKDQTQRVVFNNNLKGKKIRVRLSNRYSSNTITMEEVSVAIIKEGKLCYKKDVSLNNETVIRLGPGEECWSDELDFIVSPGDKIAVSTYVKEEQRIESICAFWAKNGPCVILSKEGNCVSDTGFQTVSMEAIYSFIKEDSNKGVAFYGFTGLQVLTQDSVKTIVAFGDSITHMSYMTNALIEQLYQVYPGRVTLLNRGIGGNRLLHDARMLDCICGDGKCFGDAGVRRFEKDVFGEEKVDYVLILEGINDIMHPVQFGYSDEKVNADDLINGYKRCVKIAHRNGAIIWGGTIMPCGCEKYPFEWMSAFEQIRCYVNMWIRKGVEFDGYLDYDEAVRDRERPGYMKQCCHIGDGLHPNEVGGKIMADTVMRLLSEKV